MLYFTLITTGTIIPDFDRFGRISFGGSDGRIYMHYGADTTTVIIRFAVDNRAAGSMTVTIDADRRITSIDRIDTPAPLTGAGHNGSFGPRVRVSDGAGCVDTIPA